MDRLEVQRDRISIIVDVLEAARQGMPKTQIMYRVNLDYKTLNQYVELLLKNELLSKILNKRIYKTTDRGIDFLECYHEVMELLKVSPIDLLKGT
jgi:predicted transcriptional regulator